MKNSFLTISLLILFVLSGYSQDITWPRELTNEGSVLTMYQPQVQNWDKYKSLDFRLAFSLKPFQGKEVVGVLYFLAKTDVNMDNHRVLVNNMTVSKVNFPSLDAEAANKMEKITRSFFTPESSQVVSLEQIVACTPKEDHTPTISVNNDPPVIFVSKRPTILLQLEGAIVKAGVKDDLEYAVNANWPLFYDKTGKLYFLYDGLEWQKSQDPKGPWTFTASLPKSLVDIIRDPDWKSMEGTIPPPTKADTKMPQVFYSDKLAELILFEGEPSYQAVKGTALKFATNTNNDIFFCSGDNKYYYLSAGRWFSSPGFSGPWTFATPHLPADFARIPLDSPASAILAFVPGTDAAKDAVMIAQIPTTIETDAAEAAKQVNISYSGEPKFEQIEGSTLYYAVNTTDKVIKVSGNQYYACYQGIWFVSSSPAGPWLVAASVPEAIYSIPSSSPVYNVTYVTQTVTTTNVVVSTYTPGYTGVYVMASPYGVVIVSGTGYYHPPYYYYPPYGYPVYYPYPVTYGCYAYHPYPYGGVAYHASYNPATGVYKRSATAYGPYGSATAGQAYNSKTGTYARGASVSTPYGSRSAGQAYNPYTGASASTRQGSNANGQWGSTTASNGHGKSASAAHVTTAGGTTGAVKTSGGDMYATKDGNVYKNTGNGWEEASKPPAQGNSPKTNSQANAASNKQTATQQTGVSGNSKSAGGQQSLNTQEMNKEAQNRQRGNMQTQQFNSKTSGAGSAGRPQGGGGGGIKR